MAKITTKQQDRALPATPDRAAGPSDLSRASASSQSSIPSAGEGTEVVLVGGVPRDVDSSIVAIVRALNAGGVVTVASCSGHGNRPGNIALADGRELIVVSDYESGRKLDRLLPDIHGSPPRALVEAIDAAMEASGPLGIAFAAGAIVQAAQGIVRRGSVERSEIEPGPEDAPHG